MNESDRLVRAVEEARAAVLQLAEGLDRESIDRRPTDDAWSVAEIVEHLVLAEGFGVAGLWRAVEQVRSGVRPDVLDPKLAARSIDEIFSGQPSRVDAPLAVVPQGRGRPAGYWLARLRLGGALIEVLAREMDRVGLGNVVMPHHIVGPLNGHQRLAFFRWHLERHLAQIRRTVEATTSS